MTRSQILGAAVLVGGLSFGCGSYSVPMVAAEGTTIMIPVPNGYGAGFSRVISDGAVFQRDGIIEAVGAYAEIKAVHHADEELGGPSYVVIPGLVNAHHHGRGVSTFQNGCIDDCLHFRIHRHSFARRYS